MSDQETVGQVADAAGEIAKTANTALKLAGDFCSLLKGCAGETLGILEDRIRVTRFEQQIKLADKVKAIMRSRGLSEPTRELPLPFLVPLLNHAFLEEDDQLRETWARLLVNASDASTKLELRTAFVEILSGMSAFDVKTLSVMVEATLNAQPAGSRAVLTTNLPRSSEPFPGHFRSSPVISRELGISLANLARLGCAVPAGGTDGAVLFSIMTVTDLGIALYKACS